MIKQLRKEIPIIIILLIFPTISMAQYGGSNDLSIFGDRIIIFINQTLVPFVFAVSLLLFIYGLYMYFFYQGGEDESRKTGKNYILWAIIAFVVMVSVWGIVNLVSGGLGLSKTESIDDLIPVAAPTR